MTQTKEVTELRQALTKCVEATIDKDGCAKPVDWPELNAAVNNACAVLNATHPNGIRHYVVHADHSKPPVAAESEHPYAKWCQIQLTSDDSLKSISLNEAKALALGYPPSLAKACVDDPWQYALKLRTGDIIEFSGANPINAEWVCLGIEPSPYEPKGNLPYPAPRGIDVRVADIVWVMDAPYGS